MRGEVKGNKRGKGNGFECLREFFVVVLFVFPLFVLTRFKSYMFYSSKSLPAPLLEGARTLSSVFGSHCEVSFLRSTSLSQASLYTTIGWPVFVQ